MHIIAVIQLLPGILYQRPLDIRIGLKDCFYVRQVIKIRLHRDQPQHLKGCGGSIVNRRFVHQYLIPACQHGVKPEPYGAASGAPDQDTCFRIKNTRNHFFHLAGRNRLIKPHHHAKVASV